MTWRLVYSGIIFRQIVATACSKTGKIKKYLIMLTEVEDFTTFIEIFYRSCSVTSFFFKTFVHLATTRSDCFLQNELIAAVEMFSEK